MTVTGPLGRPLEGAEYGVNEESGIAVVELARASGLEHVPTDQRNVLNTTTYGFGELIRAAIGTGKRISKLILGIGGSATNDAGLGALQALGLRVETSEGLLTTPVCGRHLADISRLSFDGDCLLPKHIQVIVACDVQSPFLGPEGAVAVFGQQKGIANEQARVRLEEGMRRVRALLMDREGGVDVQGMRGSGAAGGAGGGLFALAGAQMQSGIELMAECAGLREAIAQAALVVSGEGSYDAQTAQGKAVSYVAECARDLGCPMVVVCGVNRLTPVSNDANAPLVWDLVSRFGEHESRTRTAHCLETLVRERLCELDCIAKPLKQ